MTNNISNTLVGILCLTLVFLSFKQQGAIDELKGAIDELEKKQEALARFLSGVLATDDADMDGISDEYNDLRSLLDVKFDKINKKISMLEEKE